VIFVYDEKKIITKKIIDETAKNVLDIKLINNLSLISFSTFYQANMNNNKNIYSL